MHQGCLVLDVLRGSFQQQEFVHSAIVPDYTAEVLAEAETQSMGDFRYRLSLSA